MWGCSAPILANHGGMWQLLIRILIRCGAGSCCDSVGGGLGGAQLPPLQTVEESGSCFQQC